jgi:hypothetical protein
MLLHRLQSTYNKPLVESIQLGHYHWSLQIAAHHPLLLLFSAGRLQDKEVELVRLLFTLL